MQIKPTRNPFVDPDTQAAKDGLAWQQQDVQAGLMPQTEGGGLHSKDEWVGTQSIYLYFEL